VLFHYDGTLKKLYAPLLDFVCTACLVGHKEPASAALCFPAFVAVVVGYIFFSAADGRVAP